MMRNVALTLMLAVSVPFIALTGCQSMTGETMGENVDDATITSKVKTKLSGEKLINATRINVQTERGVVYLRGSVPTAEEKSKALDLAQNVKGVKQVVDHLEVRS